MPNKGRTIVSWIHKIRLQGRRRKGTAEPLSREKLRQAPQKEGGEILCDPGWYVHKPDVQNKWYDNTSLKPFGCKCQMLILIVTIRGGYRMARGWLCTKLSLSSALLSFAGKCFLKKNQNAPRPSEHPPVRGEKMSKRLGCQRLQIQNLFMAFKRVPRWK